jgi:DNA/RNA endonuclease YhcR with UshA esterase domain
MRRKLILSVATVICFASWISGAFGQYSATKLTAAQARDHIGEQATVCGKVASTRYAPMSRGKPTFLNLDKPYPAQVFTVLIWGENREKFGAPEERYRDKIVCVTGQITQYRGTLEMIVGDPQSVEVQK